MITDDFLAEIIETPLSTTVYELACEVRDAREEIAKLKQRIEDLEQGEAEDRYVGEKEHGDG